MGKVVRYKGLSKIYDLLDILYFRDKKGNPQTTLSKEINQQDAIILDLCTGTAANAIAIAKDHKSARIIGIDRSEEMLQIAKYKIKEERLDNIELHSMDATQTTYQDHTFDVVVLSLVLHEVAEDLAKEILLEAKRILKPEGKLLVLEWEEPRSIFKKILFFPIRLMEPKGFHRFLKLDMKCYFERFGFIIAGIKHCDYTKVIQLRVKNS